MPLWASGCGVLALRLPQRTHRKVIAYLPSLGPMLVKAGIDAKPDNDTGLVSFGLTSVADFIERASVGRICDASPGWRGSLASAGVAF